ncbi:MAG: hypothetical protein EZS28_052672, partial [Streblomastix strix]
MQNKLLSKISAASKSICRTNVYSELEWRTANSYYDNILQKWLPFASDSEIIGPNLKHEIVIPILRNSAPVNWPDLFTTKLLVEIEEAESNLMPFVDMMLSEECTIKRNSGSFSEETFSIPEQIRQMNVIGVDIKPPLPTTTVDARLRDAQANKRIDQMN